MQRKLFVSLYYFNNTIVLIGENVKGEREYSEFLKNTGVTALGLNKSFTPLLYHYDYLPRFFSRGMIRRKVKRKRSVIHVSGNSKAGII